MVQQLATAFSPTIGITAHLWSKWASIAVRQEQRAWEARAEWVRNGGDFAPSLGLEIEESIEAVAAARHSIHNLFRVWRHALGLAEDEEQDIRPYHFTKAAFGDAEAWLEQVRRLIGDRNDAVHHDEEMTPTQPHPGYPTNVGGVDAAFTAERATEAVNILLNDVLGPAVTQPSEPLEPFARDHGHVLGLLQAKRRRDPGSPQGEPGSRSGSPWE